MSTQGWVVNNARGLYRWERDEGWENDEHQHLTNFDEGQAVTIDPFHDIDYGNGPRWLWPVYCTFKEYVTEDVAKVYIPPSSEEGSTNCWFHHGEGEYLIHEGYLTPQ